MRDFFKSVKGKVLSAIGFASVTATSAMAEVDSIDVSSIAFDTAPIKALALTILGVLASIWIIKKVISMVR